MTPRPPSAPDPLRQAAIIIGRLEERLAPLEKLDLAWREPVAIVGMGCRFPGASDPDLFWQLLDNGRDAIRPLEPRWELFGSRPLAETPRWAGLLDHIEDFDPAFFGISPREALSLDPQHRLLLEVVWEALEDAGIVPGSLEATRTGVFFGASNSEYFSMVSRLPTEQQDLYGVTGNMLSIAAGRVAYTLGLRGPCLTLDTACSSSLVAVHLACRSLRTRESDLALAGGVNVIVSPDIMSGAARMQALSPDGRCRTFDASANGFVRGEGCGVVALKRLSDAVRDGDRVWALIKGSAVNQDGRSTGLTAPNVIAQRALLEDALASARVKPEAVSYVEAHGTGTSLGDPIEMEALGAVIGAPRADGSLCSIGAVKTNVGHLEAAAGMAGLLKVALALRHERIPANLNFRTINPRLRLDGSALALALRATPWPKTTSPRIAGVSSFGMSGTNAHVVLEEAPPAPAAPVASPPAPPRAAELLVLSGKSAAALDAAAAKLAAHVAAHPEQLLADVAFSLATTRTHHEHRLALAVGSREELLQALDAAARGETPTSGARGEVKPERNKLAFLFTGQGAQTVGMGRGLYDAWPVFRESLDRCVALFALERPLLEVMWSQAHLLDETGYTQPALFALEVALCALWRSWGVLPEVVAGHSIGELAAAHVAGVFSLEDACRLVAARGRLMQALPRGGAMMAIAAPEADVAAALSLQAAHAAQVSIAAVNGPSSVVISGDAAQVEAVASSFTSRGVRTKALLVSHAFHSPLMAPMLAEFAVVASSISYQRPSIPLISNVSGALAGAEVTTPAYWVEHVRAAVRFADGVRSLAAFGALTFIEVGPKATLSGLVPEILPELEATLVPTLRAGRPETASALLALGAFHASGGTPRWPQVFLSDGRRVALPTYPWQRQRYWLARPTAAARVGEATGHPLLGMRVPAAGADAVYEQVIDLVRTPWLADHRVAGHVLLPGAGIAEILRAAGALHLEGRAQLQSVALLAPLVLSESSGTRVQVVVSSLDGTMRATLYSQPSSSPSAVPWTQHATATLMAAADPTARVDLAALRRASPTLVDTDELYASFASIGLSYGASFRGLLTLRRGQGEALGEVSLPSLQTDGYGVHPALLDACFHASAVLVGDALDAPFLPFEMGLVQVHRAGATAVIVHVRRMETPSPNVFAVDVTLLDEAGEIVAEVKGLRAKRADAGALRRLQGAASIDALHRVEWRESVVPESGVAQPSVVIVAAPGSARAALLAARLGATVVEPGAPIPAAGNVVCLWELDDALAAATAGLALVQSLSSRTEPPRLWWVTSQAVAVSSGERVRAEGASLWGLGRVVMQEHPELRCTLVDVDDVELLARELVVGDDEDQVAWRLGQRHVARLVRAPSSGLPASEDCQLVCLRKGTLDALTLEAASRRAPAAGEVEIEVRASGLNFRDVLNALGMYPGEAGALGGECAGVVARVGDGVEALRVGDRVLAFTVGAFRRFVTTDARLAAPVPAGLSFEEAATIPVAFLTAWYALHDLAGLRRGERILIHAAAGGVGMAAVQIARNLGAEVLGTASPSKWDVVRALGVSHVANSRNLDFVAEFRAATGGVDVVLNALAGEFVDASLSLLPEGGRFLEMGKTDVRRASPSPGVIYQAFDLFDAGLDRIAEMLAAIVAAFATGSLRALPVQTFPLTEAESAFRFMAQARHVGKVALLAPRREGLRRDGTVLVTGGLGALGLRVAGWLLQQGIAHIVLAGRRGLQTPGAAAAIAALQAAGARVTVAAIDVADRAALASALAAIPAELPLRGVVHAAGALDDGVLAEQTPDRMAAVMAPKVAGARHLNDLTRDADLDLFLLFSSAAGIFGSAGQGAYAAANAYLDGLAAQRRSQGLVAQSVAWGAWGEAVEAGTDAAAGRGKLLGMASRLDAAQQAKLSRQGFGTISSEQGLSLLASSIERPEANLVVMPLDARLLGQAFQHTVPPLWRVLVRAAPRAASGLRAGWARELEALPAERRVEAVLEVVRAEVARVLSLASASAVPAERPLQELGLDSLMAVELRNALGRRVGMTLTATLAFDHPTSSAIARHLLERVVPPAVGVVVPLARLSATADDPIAVIGMGCRFPGGVEDPLSFWRLLDDGVDAVTEVPPERWDIDAWYDANVDAPGKMTTRWGGFLRGLEEFEPTFFGMAPREAASVDPQERMLLETAWEALERAGQRAEQLMGSETGVYLGLCGTEYQGRTFADAAAIDAYSLLGTAHSAMVGRLSYWLGLKGPNMPVDTACSSSLVAVHLACQALRSGECTMALAGGANVLLSPEGTVYFSRLKAMSPTGRCHAFSADADGYVRGEGCGVVVLKRLSDALRDGDPVLAVLKGSAVNQDGRSNGMTAPNGPSQQAVIRRALAQAGVAPHEIDYVECHGTGTPLGDPIEVQALSAVLGEGRAADRPVVVGSVKTNIGHAEGAAGVAGLIKAVLALQAQRIPRSLHFTSGNPNIAWDELPVKVASEALPWPHYGRPRRAGVSSFGFSGTNAHVVLEEAPAVAETPASPQRSAELLVLSAKSQAALDGAAAKLSAQLAAHPEQSLSDLAYSLATTRTHHEHRLALAVRSREELVAALQQQPIAGVRGRALGGKVVFVFPGQGSQWVGMGRELFASEPVFRTAIEACDRAIAAETSWSLIAELTGESSLIPRIDVVQPVLFAIEVALAALWRSWGVEPDCVVGHSMGEVAAAHVAGALSLADACAVICRRSVLLRRISGQGEMAVVELSVAEAEAAIVGHESALSVAVSNSPRSTVLSGSPAALSTVLSTLEERGVFCRRVKVDVASHSPQVDVLRDDLLSALSALLPLSPQVAMRSTVTAAAVVGPQLAASYWADNLRQPVRFAEVIDGLLLDGHTLFVEMSPHPLLVPSIDEVRQGRGVAVGSLRREQPERRSLLEALGALHVNGLALDWQRLFPSAGQRLQLPTSAWQRERYWLELPAPGTGRSHGGGHPLLGPGLTLSTQAGTRIWETAVDVKRLRWLADHQVQGATVFPGAAYLEMALAVGSELLSGALEVTELTLSQALIVPADGAAQVQVVAREQSPGRLAVRIVSAQGDGFIEHAHAVVRVIEPVGAMPVIGKPLDVAGVRARLGVASSADTVYGALSEMGLHYGPAFQGVLELWRGTDEALGRVALPAAAGSASAYRIHPALLDACFHVLSGASANETTPWVPVKVGALRLHVALPRGELWCHGRVTSTSASVRRCDLTICDDRGSVVAEIEGLEVQRLAVGPVRGEEEDWFLGLDWEAAAAPVAAAGSPPGRWLVLGDGGGLGAGLCAALTAAGHEVVQSLEDVQGVRGFGASPPTGIVHLRSLDGSEGDGLEAALARGCDSVLRVVQSVAAMEWRDLPRLWLVTRCAQAVGNDVVVGQAPLLGLARVIAFEHADLRCTRLDLDPARPTDEVGSLVAELLGGDEEEEVAFRAGERRVARLSRITPEAGRAERIEAAGGRPFRLEIDAPGVLDRLVLRPIASRPPAVGEVQVAVESAGLNFLDVLTALGVMPADVGAAGEAGLGFGGECAGRVIAVGAGVTNFSPGDAVMGFARSAIASEVTTPATLMVHRPASLSSAEAAALPIATLTAWYALDKVARLRRGERVLIHAASGGVGQAAVQWAQHVGAEVFATASTPEKRALLESQGVRFVSDSRSDRFVRDVLDWTKGEGVDVVLNSLSGELIEKSFALLRAYGRFVEIGKRDYYANNQLGLQPFLRNLSFSLVDLRGMTVERPEWVQELLVELMGHVASGALSPPRVESVPVSLAGDAFRKMAQARHTGKLVLTLADAEARVHVPVDEHAQIRADGSYLVTGGLGGLGLSLAGWLVEQGAGQVVLLGRNGARSESQRLAVTALQAKGAVVTVASADVSDRAQLQRVLAELPGPPLRGVFHTAGVLDDGLLMQQTPARLRTVMAPKVFGAWNLHELTLKHELDMFVLYSSAAGLLGSPGQGNYAAANTFLDALAWHRRALGLPAVSIDWGAFSEVGLAAAQEDRGQRLQGRGMKNLTPEQGLALLGRLAASAVAQVGVVPLDVRQWVEFYPAASSSRMLSRLVAEQRNAQRPAGDKDLLARLAGADANERETLLVAFLRREVSQVLRIPEEKLDSTAPLTSLGMDSLMGLELRNRIEAGLGIRASATLLWTYPTIAALARSLAGDEKRARKPVVEAAPIEQKQPQSRDDVLALLDQELSLLTGGDA